MAQTDRQVSILFISETLPINTYASSVIFYRHFKHLEEKGYKINVVTDQNSFKNRRSAIPKTWDIYLLPNRKWYLPPYKSIGFLKSFRFFIYYYLYIKKIIETEKPDIIFGFLHGQFLSSFSAYVKGKTGLPLITFYHDDTLELNIQKSSFVLSNTEYMLEKSNHVLIASNSFKNNWEKYKHKFSLLYPIPEPYTPSIKKELLENEKGLTFAYSGSLYEELLETFEILSEILKVNNCKLIIIGNNEKARLLSNKYPETVEYRNLFPTLSEATKFIEEFSDALIIPYPEKVSTMPWIKTCFPSKFIQFCHLEIPVVIIAPEESAIGIWCKKNNWELYTTKYTHANIKSLIYKIRNKIGSTQPTEVKEEQFNPEKIQAQFEDIINLHLKNK